MKHKVGAAVYRVIKWAVRVFSPRMEVIGAENLPAEPALIVGNHSQMYGPIACELYFPGQRYTWCAGEMMHAKEVPDYAFQDFWSKKPKHLQWFYRILSYLIVPLSVCVFNHADTIGVYHDSRIISTFKNTVNRLQEGASVVIFPEHDAPYDHILCAFQDRFIDVAKMYWKRTGKAISFVPLYIAPRLKKMFLGTPILFQPDAPIADERQRICGYLMEEISKIACAQPEHVVVPYNNISKKNYGTNRPKNTSHIE